MAVTSMGTPALWGGFIAFVLLMLALDLGVFHRHAHKVSMKEAGLWSAVWVTLSLAFGLGLWFLKGSDYGAAFLTGYVVEKSLSVDNIFVFVVIFSAMRIPAESQHRVLFWGILTALVLRAAMILAGSALLERFAWLMYVFGGFLLFTAAKLLWDFRKGHEEHPESGWFAKAIRRVIPATEKLHGQHFFTVENGKRLATPLFVALILVEFTDVLFALDSIPAVFAVTTDPFLVFTSNIFAILGLRSLFFLLAGVIDRFRYLKVGLSAVLAFVGVKMLAADVVHVPPFVSLGVIALLLGASIGASFWVTRRETRDAGSVESRRRAAAAQGR